MVPVLESCGLAIPDPRLRRRDDGAWEFTEPDWAEMKRVVAGDGPVSRARRALIERRYRQNRWLRLVLAEVA